MLEVQRQRELDQGTDSLGPWDWACSIAQASWCRWVTAALIVVAPVTLVIKGGAMVKEARNMHSRWKANKAAIFISEGRHDDAISILLDPFEKTPDEPLVVRTLATAAAPKHPEQAKYLYDRLEHLDALLPEDRIAQAKNLARLNDDTGARAAFHRAEAAAHAKPEFWSTRAQVDAAAGRPDESLASFERALNIAPDDLESTLGVARLLASSSDATTAYRGIAILCDEIDKALAKKHFRHRQRAFEVLCQLPALDATLRSRIAVLLGRIQQPSLPEKVLACLMQFPFAPPPAAKTARAEALRAVIWQGRRPTSDEKEQAIAILQANQEHQVVLEWLAGSAALLDPALLAKRIDSLIALGHWDEAAAAALRGDSPLSPATRDLIVGLITLQRPDGNENEARAVLSRALSHAELEGRQSTYAAIGHVALDHHLDQLAASAFSLAMQFPFAQFLPLSEYVLAARRAGIPADEVLKTLRQRELIDRWNLDLQKNICYLRLLLGVDLEMTQVRLDQMRALLPDDPAFRFLSAFACSRMGDHQLAERLLLPLPANRWYQGEAAVISSILAKLGRVDCLGSVMARVDGTGTFAEERRLMEAPAALVNLSSIHRDLIRNPGGLRYLSDSPGL